MFWSIFSIIQHYFWHPPAVISCYMSWPIWLVSYVIVDITIYLISTFLGTYAKWRKVTINFVMSVCPSICSHGSTRLPMDGFLWYFIFQYFFENLSRIFKFISGNYKCMPVTNNCVARGGAVGWGTALKTRRSRAPFPVFSVEFFIDIVTLAALWQWDRLNL
jgi:hypothetical protein